VWLGIFSGKDLVSGGADRKRAGVGEGKQEFLHFIKTTLSARRLC